MLHLNSFKNEYGELFIIATDGDRLFLIGSETGFKLLPLLDEEHFISYPHMKMTIVSRQDFWINNDELKKLKKAMREGKKHLETEGLVV